MNFRTIPLVAQARHGKDTIADILLGVESKNYCRVALADEVKLDCMAHYGKQFPFFNVVFDNKGRISYPNDTKDTQELSFRRRTWQVWGTEARRTIFPDIWLWRWADRAMSFVNRGFDGVVIPDARFFNEARHFKARGAQILAARRFDENGVLWHEPGIDYSHASERDIPDVIDQLADVIIRNDTTYEEYQTRALEVLKEEGYI